MCDFCKNIGTEEKAILTHKLDVALKKIKELKEKLKK